MAIIFGLLFWVLASSWMYSFTNGIFKSIGFGSLLDENGVPNMMGVMLHAAVFILLAFVLVQVLCYFFPKGFKSSGSSSSSTMSF